MGFSIGGAIGGVFGGIPGAIIGDKLGDKVGLGKPKGPGGIPIPQFQSTAQQAMNPLARRYQDQLNAYQAKPMQKLQAEALPSIQNAQLSPAYQQQFALMRQQAQANANRANSEQQTALERRFAQHAGLQSGAFIKQQQIAADNAARQVEEANRGVDVQQLQAQGQLEDAIRQQEQAALGRNFQREGMNVDNAFKHDVFGLDSNAKLAQLDLAYKDADHQRLVDQYTAALNQLAIQNSKKKGLLSDLTGDIFGEL